MKAPYRFGMQIGWPYDHVAFEDALAPQRLRAARIYFVNEGVSQWGKVTEVAARGLVPVVSWKERSSAYAEDVAEFLDTIRPKPVPVFYHEPEDNMSATVFRDDFERLSAIVPRLSACLMAWTWDSRSGRRPSDWVPPEAWCVGLDGYDWPDNTRYESPASVFQDALDWLGDRRTGIFECNAGRYDPNKPQWIRELKALVKSYPSCKYVLAFDKMHEMDWRSYIDTPEAMAAWREMAQPKK